MLKPFGLSVVVSDAMPARVTIIESPIDMVTLSTLAVQISISAYHHSSKSTERRLRYQVALKEVDMQQKNLQKPGVRQDQHCAKSDRPVIKPRPIMALFANLLPCNFVKFADYTSIAECIEVSNAHECMPILKTLI